jgi:hypothetical protein
LNIFYYSQTAPEYYRPVYHLDATGAKVAAAAVVQKSQRRYSERRWPKKGKETSLAKNELPIVNGGQSLLHFADTSKPEIYIIYKLCARAND